MTDDKTTVQPQQRLLDAEKKLFEHLIKQKVLGTDITDPNSTKNIDDRIELRIRAMDNLQQSIDFYRQLKSEGGK